MQPALPCESRSTLCRGGFAPFHQLAESLGNAVDARDRYTYSHSNQVADLSQHLALAMGLPEEEADRIHLAGHLHDIGKIGIPDAVLRKSGKLNEEEWNWMRQHPEIGARILAPVEGFNGEEGISDIVLCHHERFDGKGYPRGLAGSEIPLGARIVAVADTFSALIQDRPYRKGQPHLRAFEEIERHAGSQFDPDVAAAFLASADSVLGLLKEEKPAAPLPRNRLALSAI